MSINIPWEDGTSDYFTLDFTAIQAGTSNAINVTSSASTNTSRSKIIQIMALDTSGATPNQAYLQVSQDSQGIICKIANDQSNLD